MARWQPSQPDDFVTALVERIACRTAELLREQTTAEASDPWMDTTEAAAYLHVSPSRLRALAAAGTIGSEQDGPSCKRYYRRSDLDRWRQSGGARSRAPRAV